VFIVVALTPFLLVLEYFVPPPHWCSFFEINRMKEMCAKMPMRTRTVCVSVASKLEGSTALLESILFSACSV